MESGGDEELEPGGTSCWERMTRGLVARQGYGVMKLGKGKQPSNQVAAAYRSRYVGAKSEQDGLFPNHLKYFTATPGWPRIISLSTWYLSVVFCFLCLLLFCFGVCVCVCVCD